MWVSRAHIKNNPKLSWRQMLLETFLSICCCCFSFQRLAAGVLVSKSHNFHSSLAVSLSSSVVFWMLRDKNLFHSLIVEEYIWIMIAECKILDLCTFLLWHCSLTSITATFLVAGGLWETANSSSHWETTFSLISTHRHPCLFSSLQFGVMKRSTWLERCSKVITRTFVLWFILRTNWRFKSNWPSPTWSPWWERSAPCYNKAPLHIKNRMDSVSRKIHTVR